MCHIYVIASYRSPGTPYIESLNVKSWSLDHTCIHGLNKARNVTLFPHEIAQGTSWDASLVQRILNATATEARILSAKGYIASNGHNLGEVLSCDGGPSAAQAHDPRWGRVSWTWGEDVRPH
jgi:beta-glucosidase